MSNARASLESGGGNKKQAIEIIIFHGVCSAARQAFGPQSFVVEDRQSSPHNLLKLNIKSSFAQIYVQN
ncbi:MAG: hypothetical protein LJE65_01760, partial [Desulfobacteraceae bacterium]|nr:hypothetical protein [Desulfobacteraceae bacterium]